MLGQKHDSQQLLEDTAHSQWTAEERAGALWEGIPQKTSLSCSLDTKAFLKAWTWVSPFLPLTWAQ